MAGRYNFTIDQGADFSRLITWKGANDALINLTGYSARLQARRQASSTLVLIDLTNGSGLTLGGAAGTIQITMSDTLTAALDFSIAVYNLELVSPAGVTTRLLEGTITLSKEVVR